MDIGIRIRKHRQRQHRTLEDIAVRCGCTRSLISKIENGKTTPPVATLARIAAALGVRMSDLLDEGAGEGTVYRKAQEIGEVDFTRTERGYSFFAFASGRTNKLMQPFVFKARKGEVLPGTLTHAGEEFIYMLEGEMKYTVGGITYSLLPGDSLYFNSEERHSLEPVTDEVRYLAVFTEFENKQ